MQRAETRRACKERRRAEEEAVNATVSVEEEAAQTKAKKPRNKLAPKAKADAEAGATQAKMKR